MSIVVGARHRWPERAGFCIHRPVGLPTYTLLHFFTPMQLRVGDRLCTTRPGACIIYDLNSPQWFTSSEPVLHDWMHLSAEAQPLMARLGVPLDTLLYPADCAFFTAGVREIELEQFAARPLGGELMDAAAAMLLIRLVRAVQTPESAEPVSAAQRAVLTGFRAALLGRLDEPWTVARMAAEVHLSPSRFSALWRALFSVSPMNDLILARIDAAKNALTGSACSVAQLAEQLGYANVTHFSRQFRQYTGVSPRAFARALLHST